MSKQDDNKGGSFFSNLLVGAGSVAAGAGGMLIAVERSLRNNLTAAFGGTPDAFMVEQVHEVKKEMKAAARRKNGGTKVAVSDEQVLSAMGASDSVKMPPAETQAHWNEMRGELQNGESVLGKAFEKAGTTEAGQVASAKMSQGRGIHTQVERTANAIVRSGEGTVEQVREMLRSDPVMVGKQQLANTMVREGAQEMAHSVAKSVPIVEKFKMSQIGLTRGQKVGAGITFAAVTAIAGLGLYKIKDILRGSDTHHER